MLNILSLLLAVSQRCTSCLNPPKNKNELPRFMLAALEIEYTGY